MPRDRHDRVSRRPASREGGGVVAGRRAVAEAVVAGTAVEILVAEGSRATEGLRAVLDAANQGGVPVREAPRSELDALAPEHRGVVAVLSTPAAIPAMGERELAAHPFDDRAVVVVLDGVEDPQNLGAAARTCEAAGVAAIVMRTRRAAGVTPAAIRASSGALLHLPLARVANIARALERLKEAGFTAVGLDGSATGTIYDEACPEGRVAVVVGSEGSGISRLVRERCDLLVALPMLGRVASLNASASLAACLYGYVLPSRR
jgi:23S rRNA (guanosine2251-2'-O)-methyltransferase